MTSLLQVDTFISVCCFSLTHNLLWLDGKEQAFFGEWKGRVVEAFENLLMVYFSTVAGTKMQENQQVPVHIINAFTSGRINIHLI